MPSLQSSSSQSIKLSDRLYSPIVVWVLRFLIGATFVISGFVKGVDPWGSIIKISEYFTVWDLAIPHAVIVVAAFALAAYEFVWGLLLFMGCYRRVSTWLLTLFMAVMLPLTLYIAIYSPVDDCGCFGDFIILSNTATFVKNLIITAALVYLIIYNTRVAGIFIPYSQWLAGGIITIYILVIELYGYNIQPLIDFRQYAEGVSLAPTEEDDNDDTGGTTEFEYTYSKDGETHVFTIDTLPDSTWTFVGRRLISGEAETRDGFTIIEDGEDVTADVIDTETSQFLITIPDIDNVDISYTYLINELNDFITARGGSLIALINSDDEGIERWKDISMASYPIYKADPRMLKELARGIASLVYLDHGVVKWKRALSSISYTFVTETPSSELIRSLNPETGYMLKLLTTPFVIIMLVLLALDHSGKILSWHIARRKRIKAIDKRKEERNKQLTQNNN